MGGAEESRVAEARREENLHPKTLCLQVRYKHSTPGAASPCPSRSLFPSCLHRHPPISLHLGKLRMCLGEKSLSPAAPATQHLMVHPIPCISEPPPPPDFQMPDSPLLPGSVTPKLQDSLSLLFFLYSLALPKGKISSREKKNKEITACPVSVSVFL